MPTKKDLAARSSEAPQPPLRRGRGLRLSQAPKHARELAAKPSSPLQTATSPAHSAPSAPAATDPVAEAGAPAEMPSAPSALLAAAAPADLSGASDGAPAEEAVAAESVDPTGASDTLPPNPERDKRKIQLRKDLLKQCKRIARAQDRKLYQVIESALEEYLERHGAQA